ncbi:MAG: hemolysin family protein [Prevotellaceae bacterium]|nr:hemolysin family protein [Prevotellaceae bacterium]
MDEPIDMSLVAGILTMMVFSAFFSGMEIAFVSSNRMRAEMDKEKSVFTQKILAKFYSHPNGFVSTMLVGNNIVLVVYGILFAKLFDQTLFKNLEPEMAVMADTVLSTLVVLFTGEFLPKVFFKSNANKLLTVFSPIAYLFYLLLWPISKFATFLARCLLRMLGIRMEAKDDDEGFSKVDLDYLVHSSIDSAQKGGEIDEEVKIFQNALDFSELKVRDCMIPRTEINAVSITCDVSELQQMFIESGHSKIIVYEEDVDHIIGYIHSSEMFRNAAKWKERINTMPFVPETMAAHKLMKMFMQQKKSLAVVVDEFGGTSGIVALEDIVEEIFGDIEDEHDNSNLTAQQLETGEYLLSARLEIDKVNERFGLDLPESDEYMTLGGLILHYYESFPKLNEIVKIGRFEFKIVKNTMTKILLVKLKVNE